MKTTLGWVIVFFALGSQQVAHAEAMGHYGLTLSYYKTDVGNVEGGDLYYQVRFLDNWEYGIHAANAHFPGEDEKGKAHGVSLLRVFDLSKTLELRTGAEYADSRGGDFHDYYAGLLFGVKKSVLNNKLEMEANLNTEVRGDPNTNALTFNFFYFVRPDIALGYGYSRADNTEHTSTRFFSVRCEL